jgi:enamine deaminase RidA (YjgF/YER057c/UK114 family)
LHRIGAAQKSESSQGRLAVVTNINPKTISAPNGTYSHGVLLPPNAKTLYIAGQVAIRPDGVVPATLEEQSEVVWTNIVAILQDAGMSIKNLVRITSYLTRATDFPKFAPIRTKYLQDHRPASTLLVVAALADPRFLVEIEGIAAIEAK